jgi:glycerophosphoryl diester phosphodiesterase
VRKILKAAAGFSLLLALFVFANNTSRWAASRPGAPKILVHRGMAQQFDLNGATFDTCTAARMLPPEHEYIENTIPSMRAAFAAGADVVEFDIHATKDGSFAVFHDRMLECRTNGRGLTREQTMETLRTLDVGYGYTSDGGQTFPFRGRGVGQMPSMEEVFETFPDRSFLIDIKGGDPADGVLLAGHLSKLTEDQRSRLILFGREGILAKVREALPRVRQFSVASIQNCLVRYIAYGWTGLVPAPCSNLPIFVPVNIAPWLWGWPNRFADRMEGKGASIVLVGPFDGTDWSAGLDAAEDLARVPPDFNGGIWTNRIGPIAAALRR